MSVRVFLVDDHALFRHQFLITSFHRMSTAAAACALFAAKGGGLRAALPLGR